MDIAQVETTLAKRNIKAINFATRWVARRLSKYCSAFVGTEKGITLPGVSLLHAWEGELCCQDDISYKTSRHVTLLNHWATQALKGMSHCLHRTSYIYSRLPTACARVWCWHFTWKTKKTAESVWASLSLRTQYAPGVDEKRRKKTKE